MALEVFLCGNGEIRPVRVSSRPPLVAMRWLGLSIHNISPANGAFNSPLSQTGDIAPNRHSRRALRGPMSQTVLIVDDDPVQRRLLEAMVQRFEQAALNRICLL